MTVDELKRLNTNDEILMVRTLKPIKAKKAWYYLYHPKRDIIKQYEIHNISEMPKTENVPVKVMDVKAHLERIDKARKDYLQRNANNIDKQMSDIDIQVPKIRSVKPQSTITKQPNSNVINKPIQNTNVLSTPAQTNSNIAEPKKEIDLQKELEKKFDELFGSTDISD